MSAKDTLDQAEIAFFSELQKFLRRGKTTLPRRVSRICAVDAAYGGDRVAAVASSPEPRAEPSPKYPSWPYDCRRRPRGRPTPNPQVRRPPDPFDRLATRETSSGCDGACRHRAAKKACGKMSALSNPSRPEPARAPWRFARCRGTVPRFIGAPRAGA